MRNEKGQFAKAPEPTGLTVAELPLAGFPRLMTEGAADGMRWTLTVCKRTIRGETTGELKEGVDAVDLLVDTAKLLGQTELLLRLDDEAREREAALADSLT